MSTHAKSAGDLDEILSRPARLDALRRSALLDTPAEEAFDRLTRLAARLLGARTALVSLVTADRQFFKSCVGLDEPWASRRGTPLSHSFCQHAVASGEPLAVEDAREHPVLRDNAAVSDLGVVAYLGIPLITSEGEAIGSFCVTDSEPRRWQEDDISILNDLAASVMTEIELRARALGAERSRSRAAILYSVGRVLSNASGLDEAAPRLLGEICRGLGWDLGGLWRLDRATGLLIYVDGWQPPGIAVEPFVAGSRDRTFASGVGLPGRVLETGTAHWVSDVELDSNFPRSRQAAEVGLHTALAAPIRVSGGVLGAIEFFSREILEPDEELLATIEGIGNQIGQFVERRTAEWAVRESEARTRAMLASALDCVISIDHLGRIVEFNPAAETTFGRRREDVLGHPMVELLVPPSLRTAHRIGFARYLETGESRILGQRLELPALRANGEEFPVELAIMRVDLPGPPLFTAYVRDITDRKLAETERERLVEELEARANAARVLSHIADGVLLLDADGVARIWNPAAEAITGLAAFVVVDRPASEAIPGWPAIEPLVPLAAAPGGGGQLRTVPLELPDREAWLSIEGVGFPEGRVYAFRDASEERRVEQMRSDFVATASHQLRTPLAAVYGAAQTLLRQDFPLENRQRRELLEMIVGESRRLTATLDGIIHAGRVDSPGFQLQREQVDALALCREIVGAAERRSGAVAIGVAAPATVPAAAADREKLRQVLENLVDNALKYSPGGGRVEVRLEPALNRLRIAVQDEGIGIPLAERDRIFEKFYRLDPNLTRGVGGTGLGLYIARELVHRMSGRIWVESAEGPGATFVVELPLAATEPSR